MVENLLVGLENIFSIQAFLFMNLGVFSGIVFGALPGLSVVMGVSLMLPLTFGIDISHGLLLLLGVYCGGTYGGSITAIIIKTPGTAAAAVTAIDGYEMTLKGESGKALDTALVASTIAGFVSALTLLFTAPLLANLVYAFGPPEYFALAVFGLTVIASVSGESMVKGLIMAAIGVVFSTVGVDRIDGVTRLTFGTSYLAGGIGLVPAIIGLFAFGEILRKIDRLSRGEEHIKAGKASGQRLSMVEFRSIARTIFRSSAIGTVIGAIPGAGAVIASFVSYGAAKRRSPHPEEFGRGSLDGIAAAEAGNNGVTSSSMIPMLTVGVPGSVVASIILGALMMNGLVPGPRLFTEHAWMTYTVMVGLVFINVFMFLQGRLFIHLFVAVTRINPKLFSVMIIAMAVIGTFAINGNLTDVIVLLIFGILGYFFVGFRYPLPPLVLAMVLAPMGENALRQSLLMSLGDPSIFLRRPVSLAFLIITAISVLSTALSRVSKKRKSK